MLLVRTDVGTSLIYKYLRDQTSVKRKQNRLELE